MQTLLVTTHDLEKYLPDPDWIILDCRFDLANPGWGKDSYIAGHIPGAAYVSLNEDLSGTVTKKTGRHPLPDAKSFATICAQWGISPESQVVIYDTSSGSMAARLWWMLRALGHNKAAILDGGYAKWLSDRLPVETGEIIPTPSDFKYAAIFNPELFIDTAGVLSVLNRTGWKLIDVRAPERFLAELEPIDLIAGHIPGAVNRFHSLNLTHEGLFKNASLLKSEFTDLLAGVDPKHTIIYCGSGVTSCHTIFAMEVAGIKGARLYVGSWSEWIRDISRPRIP